MNKNLFKQEIIQFLAEIKTRKAEVGNEDYSTIKHVGKSIYEFARMYFDKELYPIVYSTNNVRLDSIFHIGSKKELHNASNVVDIAYLYQAIKYQILANINLYENISLEDFYIIYWAYLIKLSKYFNWSMTLNTMKNIDGFMREVPEYLPWMENQGMNILSNEAVKATYIAIFEKKDKTVLDINRNKKEINIKNSDYNTMKRLTKEQLVDIISKFDHKPTVKEITDYYMSTIDIVNTDDINDLEEFKRIQEENRAKYISKELMRKYIKSYELEDMIKSCNHSKAFNEKKRK